MRYAVVFMLMLVIGCSSPNLTNNLSAVTATTTELGGLEWHTDYYTAYKAALADKKYLLIYFKSANDNEFQNIFEQQAITNAGVSEILKQYTLALLPVDYEIEVSGSKQKLMAYFPGMNNQSGYAVMDFRNQNSASSYKQNVGYYPFIRLGGEGNAQPFNRLKPVELWQARFMLIALSSISADLHSNSRRLANHPEVRGTMLELVPNPLYTTLTYNEWRVIQLTNYQRSTHNLHSLVVDQQFLRGCRDWSKHMATSGGLNHAGGHFAENIAWNQQSPEEVLQSWMNSSGHRANILGGGYTIMGAGDYRSGNGPYWCQRFL